MNKFELVIPTRLETNRLILRRYAPGDGQMYYHAGQRNRQHLQQFESGNVILSAKTPEEAETIIQELHTAWNSRDTFFMGAFDKKTLNFVAQVYIGVVNWDLPEFEVGYFVDVDHQRKGYMTEAVKVALDFIFRDLKAWRVCLHTRDTNLPSQKIAERCGFSLEGHIRENKRDPDGSISGDLYYGLLRSEYNRNKKDDS
jgi:RimJ/RimL family protein N-acetyltransferase